MRSSAICSGVRERRASSPKRAATRASLAAPHLEVPLNERVALRRVGDDAAHLIEDLIRHRRPSKEAAGAWDHLRRGGTVGHSHEIPPPPPLHQLARTGRNPRSAWRPLKTASPTRSRRPAPAAGAPQRRAPQRRCWGGAGEEWPGRPQPAPRGRQAGSSRGVGVRLVKEAHDALVGADGSHARVLWLPHVAREDVQHARAVEGADVAAEEELGVDAHELLLEAQPALEEQAVRVVLLGVAALHDARHGGGACSSALASPASSASDPVRAWAAHQCSCTSLG